jgi:CubicO group peptidase (beta-lactamase class C family)
MIFLNIQWKQLILVLKNNKIVLEEYFNNNNENNKYNLFSVTKSIVSLGIGILQDRKLLSINDKISKYLPFLPLRNDTTIKDILQMSSGYSLPKILPKMADMGLDYFAYNLTDRLINYKVSYNPGEYFIYKNLNTQILGLLIEKISGQKLNDFINENIYKYVGREKAEWSTDRVGNIKAFCCLYLNIEDFLKIGKLILDKGKIGDKVIVSKSYLDEMFTPNQNLVEYKEGNYKNDFYGLQGWTLMTDDGHKIKYLWGIQGQYNIIIEDLDIVISYFSTFKKALHRKDYEKIAKNIIEDVRKIVFS